MASEDVDEFSAVQLWAALERSFGIVILLLAVAFSAHAEGPAVSALNGKVSAEGGVTGVDGFSSGVGIAKGSITTPLGHAFGFQLDGITGTAFNALFGGGTAHLFWRDPEIGLFGPVVSVDGGSGKRLGWYGAEAEFYATRLTFGAWAGYHDVVNSDVGVTANSGFYGGKAIAYFSPDLALTIAATSAFNQVNGTATFEFQPDLFARHNVAFYADSELANHSAYTITAGIRFYFGADKPLIRRHREDDPTTTGMLSLLTELSALPVPIRPLADTLQPTCSPPSASSHPPRMTSRFDLSSHDPAVLSGPSPANEGRPQIEAASARPAARSPTRSTYSTTRMRWTHSPQGLASGFLDTDARYSRR